MSRKDILVEFKGGKLETPVQKDDKTSALLLGMEGKDWQEDLTTAFQSVDF